MFRERHGKELPTQLQANIEAARGLQLQSQALAESIARDRDRKMMLERLYREAANDLPVVAAAPPPRGDQGESDATRSLSHQLATAYSTLANLEMRYTTDHPDVQRLKSRIADLEQRTAVETAAKDAPSPSAVVEPMDPLELQRRESQRQMLAEIESLDRQTAFKESEERRLRAEIADYQRHSRGGIRNRV